MARSNLRTTRIKPAESGLFTPRVVRREQLSAHFVRVTLAGGGLDRFRHLGFDQWFRLFIPVGGGTLDGVPAKLTRTSYLRYLTIPKATRPVLRNYTVRGYRPLGVGGPEIDVDVVRHGSAAAGTAGPGATWAETCRPGDPVGLLDEGVGFHPPAELDRVLLVADESGLPALAGVLSSLPPAARGHALAEVPTAGDRQDLARPTGVELTWVRRAAADAIPGQAALAAARELRLPGEPFYGWTVGEQQLPTGLRRHWVRAGVPKDNIMFCGYWRHGVAP